MFRFKPIFIGFLILFFSCNSIESDDLPELVQENPNDSIDEEPTNVSWPLPTPELKVQGRHLVDPCGNEVLLHGVAITTSPWFNGGHVGIWRWNDYDVGGCLNYNRAVMNTLSEGNGEWYLNMVRLHMDPYWSNEPGPPLPEHDISRFSFARFVRSIEEVVLPLVDHAESRGMYVILRPPGVCPQRIAVGDEYFDYLIRIWDHISKLPQLKNRKHVMFELANEPIEILGTNGIYGSDTQPHFDALKLFFQPMVDLIRANGAENVLWIPGSGYQSHYRGFPNNPIEDDNYGYAVHIYPGYWGQDNNDPITFRRNWNTHIKPVADIAPIAITEIDWGPEEYLVWGKGGVTGTPGTWGFGANFKVLADESGNVSWNLLMPENLIHNADPQGDIAYNRNPEACAYPVYNWFRAYAQEKTICGS